MYNERGLSKCNDNSKKNNVVIKTTLGRNKEGEYLNRETKINTRRIKN